MKKTLIALLAISLFPDAVLAAGSPGELALGWRILIVSLAVLTLILILVRIFAPALLAIPYSVLLARFARSAPYMDPAVHFPNSKILKDNWREIQQELIQLMAAEQQVPTLEQVDKVQSLFAKRDGIPWRTFFLKAFDNWIPGNCGKVPFTSSLFRDMPEVTTVMFSIMEAGKHIPGHRGIFKGVLRYHLALMVPEEGKSYLEVKGKKYYWKEGEEVMFDDTFYHEAFNHSNATRVVLFVDVLREQSLPKWLRPLNKKAVAFFSRIKRVKKAVKNAEMDQHAPAYATTHNTARP